jgi:FAD/FMN-containing dehydrogenase
MGIWWSKIQTVCSMRKGWSKMEWFIIVFMGTEAATITFGRVIRMMLRQCSPQTRLWKDSPVPITINFGIRANYLLWCRIVCLRTPTIIWEIRENLRARQLRTQSWYRRRRMARKFLALIGAKTWEPILWGLAPIPRVLSWLIRGLKSSNSTLLL